MNLDDQIAAFLAKTDAQPARSKLEPYAELIRGLRKRRWTYRRIAAVLREQFGVITGRSTVHEFVKVRARRPQTEPTPAIRAPQPVASHPAPPKRRFHLDM